jgi:pimeloyl-ACP methyl ester carboxylesterase
MEQPMFGHRLSLAAIVLPLAVLVSALASSPESFAESRLTAIDPQGGLISPNGQVTSDPLLLALHGDPRTGMTADGATRLVLRCTVSGPGEVTFSVTDESGRSLGVGFLSLPHQPGQEAGSVTAVAHRVSTGQWKAFAVLRAPEDFVRGPQDFGSASRTIVIHHRFNPASGNRTAPGELKLELRRAPVLLLHGLWSTGCRWQWPLMEDERFRVHAPSFPNAVGFGMNMETIRDEIRRVVNAKRTRGVACTRVTVVGHSMGGLLARMYVAEHQRAQYRRPDNFFEGDVHKLITIATPHSGSPWADLLFISDKYPRLSWLGRLLTGLGRCVDCGAAWDLRTTSDTIRLMQAADVPSHVIRSDVTAWWRPGSWLRRGDLIVELESQSGGLDRDYVTTLKPTVELTGNLLELGLHWTLLNDHRASSIVVGLLNACVTNRTVFAPGLPPSPLLATLPTTQITQQSQLYRDTPRLANSLLSAFVLPGLVEGYVPQGITWRDDREEYLISLYHEWRRDDDQPNPPSVLAIHDRAGELQRSIVLGEPDGSDHSGQVGGIAVSDNHLWVASHPYVYRFGLEAIDAAIDGELVVAEMRFRPDSRASHVAVHRGWLWVGEFAQYADDRREFATRSHHHMKDRVGLQKYAWAAGYRFDQQTGAIQSTQHAPDIGLRPDGVISMRQRVQGMAFASYQGDSVVVLSVSYGDEPSRLASYRLNFDRPHVRRRVPIAGWGPIPTWFLDGESHMQGQDAPRGSVGLVFTPEGLAVTFEAGANRYGHWTGYREDRVLVLDRRFLLH